MLPILDLILLVDDSEDDNFIHRRAITKAGIAKQVDEVYNGKEAIEYLTNSGKYASRDLAYPTPNMILLDINMPIMNGWEFLDAYNKLDDEVKAQVVVVMLTTSQSPEDLRRARALTTVADFLVKPLDVEKISSLFPTLL